MILSKAQSIVAKSKIVFNKNLLNSLLNRYMSSAEATAGGRKKFSWEQGSHEPNPELWRRIFIYVCIPAIIIGCINAYLSEKEHLEHYHRYDFKPYSYMRIRNSPLPWGDGNHGLFHNPKFNPLPDGWEELPEEELHKVWYFKVYHTTPTFPKKEEKQEETKDE